MTFTLAQAADIPRTTAGGGLKDVQDAKEEIQPVLASDQERLTLRSMQSETEQFRALGRWRSSLSRLKSHEAQRDQAKLEWERGKSMTGNGQVSPAQLMQLEFNYQNSLNQVSRTEAEVQRGRLQAVLAKHQVLSEGNPNTDYRGMVAQEMLKSMRAEQQNLESSRRNAQLSVDYYRQRHSNGKYLHERGVITKSDLERRTLDLANAEDQVRSYAHEVKTAGEAIEGLQKTLQRLVPTR